MTNWLRYSSNTYLNNFGFILIWEKKNSWEWLLFILEHPVGKCHLNVAWIIFPMWKRNGHTSSSKSIVCVYVSSHRGRKNLFHFPYVKSNNLADFFFLFYHGRNDILLPSPYTHTELCCWPQRSMNTFMQKDMDGYFLP